jgi:glycosyltransferase involved in cell wall biosynthesis
MQNKPPLVSVIMNCHNGAKYLRSSVDSLLNQTYENWELIFFDNKSTDDSKNIIFSIKDSRVKYFHSDNFINLHQARNKAIQYAQGKYISFLDTDDLWIRNKLEIQINNLESSNACILYSNIYLLKENHFFKKKKLITNKKLPSGKILINLLKNYIAPLPTIIIKSQLLNSLKFIFNEKFEIIGDFDLMMRLAMEENIIGLDQPLAFYRIHESNFSKNKNLELSEKTYWLSQYREQLVTQNPLIDKLLLTIEKKIYLEKNFLNLQGKNKIKFILSNLFLIIKHNEIKNCIKSLLPDRIVSRMFYF